MRRDAEKFRCSLKAVDEYKRPEVYRITQDDYASDARYIDTEYVHYMGAAPSCRMLTLHYESPEAARRRAPSLSWTIHSCNYPIWVITRDDCIHLIRRVTKEVD